MSRPYSLSVAVRRTLSKPAITCVSGTVHDVMLGVAAASVGTASCAYPVGTGRGGFLTLTLSGDGGSSFSDATAAPRLLLHDSSLPPLVEQVRIDSNDSNNSNDSNDSSLPPLVEQVRPRSIPTTTDDATSGVRITGTNFDIDGTACLLLGLAHNATLLTAPYRNLSSIATDGSEDGVAERLAELTCELRTGGEWVGEVRSKRPLE